MLKLSHGAAYILKRHTLKAYTAKVIRRPFVDPVIKRPLDFTQPFARPAMAARAVKDKIELTEAETQLFDFLLETLREQPGCEKTVLRCAGGWVRDKLLGLASDDIDIAINDMTGEQFGNHVTDHMKDTNMKIKKVAVIKSNPEQSKHLATATVNLLGFSLDFVNLRSETYTDSRIPQISFGTPEEDAKRRDFTINSLFYNLNSKQVEDFTEKGRSDLKEGIIRTPLTPLQTFKDDPLRVLRALRFGSRFGFTLDEELKTAASTSEVRDALASKVSRERMGVELEKIFTGKRAVDAMRDLHVFGLCPAVFTLPTEIKEHFSEKGVECMESAQQLLDFFAEEKAWSKAEQKWILSAAFFLPIAKVKVQGNKDKDKSLSSFLILQQIKWSKQSADNVRIIHENITNLAEAVTKFQAQSEGKLPEALRKKLGLSLKALKSERWRAGILCASLLNENIQNSSSSSASVGENRNSACSSEDNFQRRLEFCKEAEMCIEESGLSNCWEWKALVDGKQIQKAFKDRGKKAPEGKEMGRITNALAEFHFANPNATYEDGEAFVLGFDFSGK